MKKAGAGGGRRERMTLQIYQNLGADIYSNLAIEEWLMEKVYKETVILFLWSNEPTVVIGRNQNPWRECDVNKMYRDGVLLARRKSGGGAVYQDAGNLNYSVMGNVDNDQSFKVSEWISAALGEYHIVVQQTGRNDLVAMPEGKKISGMAFLQTEDAWLVHGTLLIDVDLEKMQQYLTVSREKLQEKGIHSVKSRVENLKSRNPAITPEGVSEKIYDILRRQKLFTCERRNLPEPEKYQGIRKMYEASDWNYGTSFSFSWTLEGRFTWGEVQVRLQAKQGKIVDIHVYSDAMRYDVIGCVQSACRGMKLNPPDIAATFLELEKVYAGKDSCALEMIRDIYGLFIN